MSGAVYDSRWKVINRDEIQARFRVGSVYLPVGGVQGDLTLLPSHDRSEYPWRHEPLLYGPYWGQELSTVEIADRLGCTQQTVSKWMQLLNIPRRNPRTDTTTRTCYSGNFDWLLSAVYALLMGEGGLVSPCMQMNSAYRHVSLTDRSCPECGRLVTAVCKSEGTGEKYWFACNNSRDACRWGEQTPTHRSDGERVT